MKKLAQKILISGAIATTGLLSTGTAAFSQAAPTDANVNFTGTVGSVCLFSNNISGILIPDGPNGITSGEPGLGGFRPPGSAVGSVDLDCTGGVNFSVSLPQDNGSTIDLIPAAIAYSARAEIPGAGPFAGAFAVSSFSVGTFNTLSSGILLGPFSETIEVGMFVNSASAIPAGAYNYSAVITATPQ